MVPAGRVVAARAVAAGFTALAAAACGGGSSVAVLRPSVSGPTVLTVPASAQPSSAKASADPKGAVLRQYDAFWRALPSASTATTDPARLKALFNTTTTPEISQIADALGKQRAGGKVLYGYDVSHAHVTSITADVARVTDCQDSSHFGQKDLKSGHALTVGAKRNPVTVTLLKRNGAWKVSVVHYRPVNTC